MIRKYVYFFMIAFCCLFFSCVAKRNISFNKDQDILLLSRVLLQYDFYQAKILGDELVLYERHKTNPSDTSSLYTFIETNRIEIPKEVKDKRYIQNLVYIEKRERVLYYVEVRLISGLNMGVLFTDDGKISVEGLQVLERLHGNSWNKIMYFETY